MQKILFEDATLTSQAKVTIDGVDHLVTEAEYGGGTDLNANTFNQLQDNVENAINGVVESGSNENGSWIKWADGTMICTGKIPFSCNSNWTDDTMYYKDAGSLTFPQEFIKSPIVNANFVGNGSARVIWTALKGTITTTETGSIFAITYWNASYVFGEINVTAIGRWK